MPCIPVLVQMLHLCFVVQVGCSPLHYACRSAPEESDTPGQGVVAALIEAGALVDKADSVSGLEINITAGVWLVD